MLTAYREMELNTAETVQPDGENPQHGKLTVTPDASFSEKHSKPQLHRTVVIHTPSSTAQPPPSPVSSPSSSPGKVTHSLLSTAQPPPSPVSSPQPSQEKLPIGTNLSQSTGTPSTSQGPGPLQTVKHYPNLSGVCVCMWMGVGVWVWVGGCVCVGGYVCGWVCGCVGVCVCVWKFMDNSVICTAHFRPQLSSFSK